MTRRFLNHVSRIALLQLCVCLGLLIGVLTNATAWATAHENERYIGSLTCKGCHAAEYNAWQTSDHAWSMREASHESVKGDFNDASFEYFGRITKFYKKGESFWLETQNESGEQAHYEVIYTFGTYPLQQYLVSFPKGRYQILNIAWDSRTLEEGGQKWFHLFPEKPLLYDSPLHWTGPYQRWNSRCAHCHSTNFKKNFDPRTETYTSSWAEVNVACEACHGPGKQHQTWAQASQTTQQISTQFALTRWLKSQSQWQVGTQNTAINKGESNLEQLEQCAGCHARRTLLNEESSSRLEDAYQLRLLEPPLYHADGQINDEVFVYGSFLQSKMYAKGVECSNCHEPHSLALKAQGNQLCSQCHATAVFDQPQHSRHQQGSTGAQCVNCHMPATTYMQIDPRRDHSLRIPRPDLSQKTGVPNACNQCHDDKSPAWAADVLARWLKEKGKTQPEHYSDILVALAEETENSQALLTSLLQGPVPAIVKASALSRLGAFVEAGTLKVIEAQRANPDPLVRRAALMALQSYPLRYKVATAVESLYDEVAAVRFMAYQLLFELEASQLPKPSRKQYEAVGQEYSAWLGLHADTPDGQLRYGNLKSAKKEYRQAEIHYKKALEYNAQFVPAMVNLAELYRRQDKDLEALPLLNSAIINSPNDGALYYALGLLKVRQKDYQSAASTLKQASVLAPHNMQYGFVAAVALEASGNIQEAIELLTVLKRRFPQDTRIEQALSSYKQKQSAEER